jgi:hypothetical protein
VSLSRKAQQEVEAAQILHLHELRQLQAEELRFKLAKAQNKNMLPITMWSDWEQWRKKLWDVDRRYSKYYK